MGGDGASVPAAACGPLAMREPFLLCDSVVRYASACAAPGPAIPVLSRSATVDDHGLSFPDAVRAIVTGPRSTGGPPDDAVVIAVPGPAVLCAALLAAATGRPLELGPAADHDRKIAVALAADIGDPELFAPLDALAEALDRETPWRRLPNETLVTGRDLAALSWMTAKIVVAHEHPAAATPRLRHYAPGDDGSLVTEVAVDGAPARDVLAVEPLLASYRRRAEVMAFRTHGSESCAKGGAGTVLCGLELGEAPTAPAASGALACAHGHACPRGPHPVALKHFATDVLMLGTCNGLRLADSLNDPRFNFALSFVEGDGLAYVSSVFSSSGGDAASVAFLAAMADGATVGAATTLINALIHHAGLERPAYAALGDPSHRVGARALPAPVVLDALPARCRLGTAHTAELRLRDPALVAAARTGSVSFATEGAGVLGFHRVEAADDGDTLVLRLLAFPEPLGTVRVAAVDRTALRGRARRALGSLDRWLELWRLAGLDRDDPAGFADLRAGEEDVRGVVARGLAQAGLDGTGVTALGRRVDIAEALAEAAGEAAVDALVPQLQGSFWLPNLYAPEQRLERGEPVPCPSCGLSALRREMSHAVTEATRIVVVCPRCGIGWDVAADAAVEAISVELTESATVGGTLAVDVVVRLRGPARVDIHPRLSTAGFPVPAPEPASAPVTADAAGTVRAAFLFALPVDLPPHRHYVKVLVADGDGLAFASRPFFAAPPVAQPVAAAVGVAG